MKLNQVTLTVNDMEKSVHFYLQLGFLHIVDTPHYARFSCPDEGATFSLSLAKETNQQTEQGNYTNGTTIYFEEENLDEWVVTLQSRGITFEQLPKSESYLWREAILLDPTGNKIKLYWAGENRLNPPWRVNKTYQHHAST